jgi:vacuolar-type H+-ATPase subunit C/Vma6
MQTSYIYSASRVKALEQYLLTKTDIERLLVAEPGEGLQSALKETYLAPYVAHVLDESIPLAIEQTLIDAKRLIHSIAPNGNMFRLMWVQYDIHNMRVFSKAIAKGMSFKECMPYLSRRGIYTPEDLYDHVENKTLDHLQPEWQKAFDQAAEYVRQGQIDKVDGVFDELHFETSKHIVKEHGDDFMKEYLKMFIDLYNLKSRFRHLKNVTVFFTPTFVEGGTIAAEQIETLEDVYAMLARFGGENYWKDTIEYFQETGNFNQLRALMAERMLILAKERSIDMFSSASLVYYYLKCRQAAANIRTIVVGKNSGMSISDIRNNLRMAYVNE